MSWLETYRGTVNRWEVDTVDHFTVAYYFARFEDATLGLLAAVGLDPASLAGNGGTCVTVDCHVRYLKELRVGDILHIRSGVIRVDDSGLGLGHEVINSDGGAVCTTVEQNVALVDTVKRVRRLFTATQQEAVDARRVEWSVPEAPPARAHPATDDGFVETSRDAIRPHEVDGQGQIVLSAYIHRFSSANAHLFNAFGMTPTYLREQRRGFSTFEFRLRCPGALQAGDLARVRSALLHVGNSSMHILHRLANARTGEVVVTLVQSGVHLDLDARRPVPLPDDLRERAKAMLV
jgi:acyl-CoA thioesterase FadM